MTRLTKLTEAQAIKTFIIAELSTLKVNTDLATFNVVRAEITNHGKVFAVDFKSEDEETFFEMYVELHEGRPVVYLERTNVSAGVNTVVATLHQLESAVVEPFTK